MLIKVLQWVSEMDMLNTSGEKNIEWFYSISAEVICENVATGTMQSVKNIKWTFWMKKTLQEEIFFLFNMAIGFGHNKIYIALIKSALQSSVKTMKG